MYNINHKKKSEKEKEFQNLIIMVKIKILIILFSLYLLFIINNNYKICICTIGKNENKYIREFIEYYKKYGVDKIFIYDNNDLKGERFDIIINDYIKNKYVEIINYRGYRTPQKKMMNDCYKLNYLKYDWIIFYDIDEYIFLKNFTNLKKFLKESKFNKCKVVYLNWIFYTDNNHLYYHNESLAKRFTEINFNVSFYIGKSILRGNIKNMKIINIHYMTKKIKACNGFGNIINKYRGNGYIVDLKYNYIKHYSFKSTEEFINKIKQGNVAFNNTNKLKYLKILNYFKINKITLEKINIIEKKTGINLNRYRKKINVLKCFIK